MSFSMPVLRRTRRRRPAMVEEPEQVKVEEEEEAPVKLQQVVGKKQAAARWLSMLAAVLFVLWSLFRYQMEALPASVSERGAGVRGFSEERAYRHVKTLASLGPHQLRSAALNRALQYVYDQAVEIQETMNFVVEVEVDRFKASPGLVNLNTGLFKEKSLLYSELEHVVVCLHSKYDDYALRNALLVSSHVDTVITAEGAGDCSSCVGVMLELARALFHWAHGFKHSIIFLFNTGEEDGLLGSHNFMSQHPWICSIRAAIDLEAMRVGGKSFLFQGGPNNYLVETFAKMAKHPATMMLAP